MMLVAFVATNAQDLLVSYRSAKTVSVSLSANSATCVSGALGWLSHAWPMQKGDRTCVVLCSLTLDASPLTDLMAQQHDVMSQWSVPSHV